MEIKKISIEFTDEEIEALHYVLELGNRSYKRNTPQSNNDWIELAEQIRKQLPIKLVLAENRRK